MFFFLLIIIISIFQFAVIYDVYCDQRRYVMQPVPKRLKGPSRTHDDWHFVFVRVHRILLFARTLILTHSFDVKPVDSLLIFDSWMFQMNKFLLEYEQEWIVWNEKPAILIYIKLIIWVFVEIVLFFVCNFMMATVATYIWKKYL